MEEDKNTDKNPTRRGRKPKYESPEERKKHTQEYMRAYMKKRAERNKVSQIHGHFITLSDDPVPKALLTEDNYLDMIKQLLDRLGVSYEIDAEQH